MTLNKIKILLLMVMPLLMVACSNDEDDLFSESAATRMQNHLTEVQKVLTSADNGWALDYFPDRNLSYGGFAYTLQFTDTDVTVGTELSDETETSLYRMESNMGPVLTFDTYNSLMHYFATPSSSRYEAYDGDFEFVIDSVANDLIVMHGKRTGVYMYMHRLEKSAEQYIADVQAMDDNIFTSTAVGKMGDTDVELALDLDGRWVSVYTGDSLESEIAYVVTDNGMRLQNTITVAGQTIDGFICDGSTATFTPVYQGETLSGSFVGQLPEGYITYEQYIGQYTLAWGTSVNAQTADVELVPAGDGKTFRMKGLSDVFEPVVNYNKSNGLIRIEYQEVLSDDEGTILMAPSTASGSFYPYAGYGIEFTPDAENPGQFSVSGYGDSSLNGFYFVEQHEDGWYLGHVLVVRNNQMRPVTSLIKK